VPTGITRGNMWHADGSLTGRFPPHIKGTFFDVDELNYLFRSLSDLMQYDIGDIVASGKYRDTREYMTALVEKMKEASGGTLPSDEDLYRTMLYPISIWGIAVVELASTEPDKMVSNVKEPYSIPLLRGDMAAAADVISGREHMAVWEGDEREGTMTVFPAEGFAKTSDLIGKGSGYGRKHEAKELECEHCRECGAPAGVSKLFKWEKERCRIEERFSGRRYCFNNTQGISAVLKMLVGELGEDVEQKMVEIVRGYSRSLYAGVMGKPEGNGGLGGTDHEAQLASFPYRGWGRVTEMSDQGDVWVVAVENPYNEIMLSGRIWGLVEASSSLDLRLTVREVNGIKLRLELRR
jgi:hypothetical protein